LSGDCSLAFWSGHLTHGKPGLLQHIFDGNRDKGIRLSLLDAHQPVRMWQIHMRKNVVFLHSVQIRVLTGQDIVGRGGAGFFLPGLQFHERVFSCDRIPYKFLDHKSRIKKNHRGILV
jgi:hypothetical protein